MTIPQVPEPIPIEPEPQPLEPGVPGRPPDPVDRIEADIDEELDTELEASFPSSDPPSSWAGPDDDSST